jgi:hypothetical protein
MLHKQAQTTIRNGNRGPWKQIGQEDFIPGAGPVTVESDGEFVTIAQNGSTVSLGGRASVVDFLRSVSLAVGAHVESAIEKSAQLLT